MKISYWSDFNCPYCYIGFTRLNKAIEELKINDIKLDVHSFELDPNAPIKANSTTIERFSKKYNMTQTEAKKEIDKITKWATDEGIVMNYETAKFTNSRDAHRLMKLAIQSNNQNIIKKLSSLLYEVYFTKNYELADKEVLLNVAIESGLDKQRTIEVLNSDIFDNEVELDERVASETGIQGVPYYIFNNKYAVPGFLPTSEFINVIKKVKFEEDIAHEYELKQHTKN